MPVKVDSAIIFAPAGELVPPALEALEKGGTLALAGIHMTPIPEMDYQRYVFHERDLRSVTCNTRQDGRDLLAEAAEIPIRPHTTTYPLAEANRGAHGSQGRPPQRHGHLGDGVARKRKHHGAAESTERGLRVFRGFVVDCAVPVGTGESPCRRVD